MTTKELVEILSKQDPDSQVHVLQLHIDREGNVDGDDNITLDDVAIYTNKQNQVIFDIREAQ